MYFHDLGVGNGFLNLTPKIQATKKKKKKRTSKINNVSASKDTNKTIYRMGEKHLQIMYLIKV